MHLPRCLKALMHQTFVDFEVVGINNGPTDKSVDGIEERWPDINVSWLYQNVGFAKANHLSTRMTRGEWLALLNSDTFLEPDWLEKLLQTEDHLPEFSFFAFSQKWSVSFFSFAAASSQ